MMNDERRRRETETHTQKSTERALAEADPGIIERRGKWQEAKREEEDKLRSMDHDATQIENETVDNGMDNLGPCSGRTIGNLGGMNGSTVYCHYAGAQSGNCRKRQAPGARASAPEGLRRVCRGCRLARVFGAFEICTWLP
jgi:hypothetical protein